MSWISLLTHPSFFFYPGKFTLHGFIMQSDFCDPLQTSQITLHNYDPGTFMSLAMQSPLITT